MSSSPSSSCWYLMLDSGWVKLLWGLIHVLLWWGRRLLLLVLLLINLMWGLISKLLLLPLLLLIRMCGWKLPLMSDLIAILMLACIHLLATIG